MTEPNDAFRCRLLGIFAEEAREHLAQVNASLVALEQAPAAARPGLQQAILKVLHTLKGAARSVDLGELENLCHALEGVFAGAARGAMATPDQFDRLHRALALAQRLIDQPGGRTRNEAMALIRQLDEMSAQANAPAPVAGPAPRAAPPDLMPAQRAKGERIRVQARDLDAIRCEAEALLPLELRFHYHTDELRALVEGMAAQRQAGGRAPAAQFDSSAFELQCAQLAAQLGRTCAELTALRARLMGATLATALVPFATALDELPALVRNLARRHGKRAQLSIDGAQVALDRRVLDVLREAMIHLVSNAVDHAIEEPAQRQAAGKPLTGQIAIAVAQRGSDKVAVRISDDGAGIDVAAVTAAAALHCQLDSSQLDQMAEPQRLQLALRSGVSTRQQVGSVSGRGMGLAIVAEKVAAAGGELRIENMPGAGCVFELLLPVGIASLRALVVRAAGLRYVVPLAGLECVRALGGADIQTVEGRETVLAAASVVPLIRLALLFGNPAGAAPDTGRDGVGLVARAGTQTFVVLVDAVEGEQDVLPKDLGTLLQRVRYVSGATQLGDGTLALIISMDDIANHALAASGAGLAVAPAAAAGTAPRVLVVEDSVTSRLLLKHILEGTGCTVDTAVDGLDALSKLRQGQYDAVVSDIEMPNMDGLALTASIRANPKTAELPIILVTSLQSPEQRERGLRAGADAYFTKGAFDQDRLLATVRRMI